ncbi:hypothetical protein [Actinomadura sp. 6N118]|uniref:hypothetical protein n=1 Tax=Actinomadura sp. 6N118 TaxID=3375151 RepID=UPI0037BF5BCB
MAAGGQSLLLGDPETGEWAEPLTVITCLDVGSVRGRPITITSAKDSTICVWDLARRRLLRQPFREYGSEVFA